VPALLAMRAALTIADDAGGSGGGGVVRAGCGVGVWRGGRRGPGCVVGGFTLIEVIVTVVVLSVVFGVVAPRLLALGSGEAEAEVERVAGAVSAVARRSALGSERLAVVYEPGAGGGGGVIRVESFRTGRGEGEDGEAIWRTDPFVDDVELSGAGVWRAVIGGVEYRGGEGWRFELVPGQVRRSFVLELRERPVGEGSRRWVIDLPSYGARVGVIDAEGRSSFERLSPVDLDEAGDGEGRW